jgi:hypothetical protein
MEHKEAATLIGLNKINYPHAYKDMKQTELSMLIDSWYNAFKNLPGEMVLEAYNLALRHCKFSVTVADIYEQIRGVQEALREPTEVLWRKFIAAAHDCYELQKGFYYTADSFKYPGMTQGQERKHDAGLMFERLAAETQEYVGNLSRLISFGAMDSGHLEQIIFPAFRRFVEQERKRSATLQQLSPGMRAGLAQEEQKLLPFEEVQAW